MGINSGFKGLNIFIYEYEAKPKQLRADEERLRKIRQI
jgi:hypothetical protein